MTTRWDVTDAYRATVECATFIWEELRARAEKAEEQIKELERRDFIRNMNGELYIRGAGGDASCAVDVLLARAEKAERELSDEKQKVDELQAQLCRAREAFRAWVSCPPTTANMMPPEERENIDLVADALSASAPCRHEEEANRLREAVEWKERFYVACLEEIAKGRGECDRHPLKRASNTIESMKRIARLATEQGHGPSLAGEPCVCELCMELFG